MKPIATPISPPHKKRPWWKMHLVLRKPLSSRTKFVLGFLALAAMLGCYEWMSYKQHIKNPDDTTIPSFTQLNDALVRVTTPDHRGRVWLWEDMQSSYLRYITGFSLGVCISIVLGIMMGCFPVVEAILDWPTRILAKVPATGVVAIFFIIWGTGLPMFVALLTFGITPFLTQAVYQAVKYDVPDEYIYKGYTLGASNMESITQIIFPHVLPRILEAARLQVSAAVVYLIAAELALAPTGFGARMRVQFRTLDFGIVYDYVVIVFLSGLFFDVFLGVCRFLLCRWSYSGAGK
jgi:NitT/TauT family transport system permease protein